MIRHAIVAFGLLIVPIDLPGQSPSDIHWPSFRGAGAGGIAEGYATATEWDVERGTNIKWKTAIPGLAHSSPVVWGDRLFVTTAVRDKDEAELKVGLYGDIAPVEDEGVLSWKLYGIDKTSGEILWERTAHRGVPRTKRHPKSTHANSTPATDGKHVIAFFGSEGLYCYDFEGNLLWKKDLGTLDSVFFKVPDVQWGFASSPVIHGDLVIVQCDVRENSFITALRIEDGEEVWRTPREDVPTWSTPTVHEGNGRRQVIVNGYKHIGAYELSSGEELWRLTGGGDIPVPTPVVSDGLIFITNAHGPAAPIYAIKVDAVGDISLAEGESTNRYITWSRRNRGNYMQTVLVHQEYLVTCQDGGVMTVYQAKTGEIVERKRLGKGGGFSASPVAADGKLYFTSEDGDVYVVKAAPDFEVLATNPMGETAMATPAISEGVLFFRTRGHLVAVSR